jgi:hypothetical protein
MAGPSDGYTQVSAGGRAYEAIAASQAAQPMGATGAIGDTLDGIYIFPATLTPGAVSIADGNVTLWTFPAITVADLRPIFYPFNWKAVVAATPGWRITTGANVSALAWGQFS